MLPKGLLRIRLELRDRRHRFDDPVGYHGDVVEGDVHRRLRLRDDHPHFEPVDRSGAVLNRRELNLSRPLSAGVQNVARLEDVNVSLSPFRFSCKVACLLSALKCFQLPGVPFFDGSHHMLKPEPSVE